MDEPITVGYCEACGGEIYDYELTHCEGCCIEIHTSCEKQCAVCGSEGCAKCLKEDEESGEYLCDAGDNDCLDKFQTKEVQNG